MNVVLDFVCTEDHQIQGRLHGGDLDQPAAFTSWLEFLQLLEALGSRASDDRQAGHRNLADHFRPEGERE